MAKLFISHSSNDDAEITKISNWLIEEGFDDHFVDHIHIPAGISWNRELPRQISNTGIMMLYVTQNWLSSPECFSEYRAAYYGNKVIIPLLVSDQLVDLKDEENKRFQALCSSVQGVSIKDFPPDDVTSKLLKGSLELSSNKIKRTKQKKLIRRVSLTAASFFIILTLIAAYFRVYIGVHIEKLQISDAFHKKTASEFTEMFNNIKDKSVNDRKFLECESDVFCPEMIVLPEGSYLMGATDDLDPDSTETPNMRIDIPQFAVSVYEITRSQWLKCYLSTRLDETGACKEVLDLKNTLNHPIDMISWQDTKIYIKWLNVQVAGTPDGPYRLLSEAEWEYAARGLTSASELHTIYPWGDQPKGGCEYANALDINMPDTLAFEREGLVCPNSSVMATQVGSFKPNEFGLYDISGNLAEWVEDCWHESYNGRPTDASSWIKGADDNCERVIRGGSWAGVVDHLRSAARTKLKSNLFGFNIGFRVARDLDWSAEN